MAAFPGKEGGAKGQKGVRVNIGRLYDEKYNQLIQKVYDKMDFAITASKDEIVDVIGYLGKGEFYREKRILSEITEDEFIRVFHEKNMLKDVMFAIS